MINVALRAFLMGAVSGGRSMTGLAAAALSTPRAALPNRWAVLAGAGARGSLAAAALGEVVVDKLPGVPSRTTPPALAVRVVTGSAAAAVLAIRSGQRPWRLVPFAVAGALAGSGAGARWRTAAERRGWHPLVAAVAEDLLVIGTAIAVSRAPAVAPRSEWAVRGSAERSLSADHRGAGATGSS